MDISFLVSLGMHEKSARIYLAMLALGTASVQDIAHKAGIKRPTVYTYLDALIERGYVAKVVINGKTYYTARDPQEVYTQLKKSVDSFRSALSDFRVVQEKIPGKPKVMLLEGSKGVRSIYDEAKRAHGLRMWFNPGVSHGHMHDVCIDLADHVRTQEVHVRDLIADTPEARKHARLMSRLAGPTYTARVATVEGLANDSMIYEDVLVFFSLHEVNMFAIRIQDRAMVQSIRALFDMAWKSALPLTRKTCESCKVEP